MIYVLDLPSDESSQTSEGEEDQSLIRLCSRSGSDSKGDSDREHHPEHLDWHLLFLLDLKVYWQISSSSVLDHFTSMNIVDVDITGTKLMIILICLFI